MMGPGQLLLVATLFTPKTPICISDKLPFRRVYLFAACYRQVAVEMSAFGCWGISEFPLGGRSRYFWKDKNTTEKHSDVYANRQKKRVNGPTAIQNTMRMLLC